MIEEGDRIMVCMSGGKDSYGMLDILLKMKAGQLQGGGQALALKIADGNKPALFAASIEALDQLGWLDSEQREALKPWRSAALKNIKGAEVGERRSVFQIQMT